MQLYQWVLALHVISVIAWMAGLLYLPRLFVYHADTKRGSESSELFKIMEKRLLRFIVNPAMFAMLLSGAALAYLNPALLDMRYMQAKVVLVLAMFGLHGFYAKARRDFEKDQNVHSAKFWKILNEIPALLMIAVVVLVIVKPM
jgi:protoporphyrinogen IX oxidase